jgi:hypothetical protein
MKTGKLLIVFAAVIAIGGAGFVVGSQGQQQHDLGLDEAVPDTLIEPDAPGAAPGIPVPGNAVFRVVGQDGDVVVVELLIKQGDSWHPAKIQSTGSGFEFAGGN